MGFKGQGPGLIRGGGRPEARHGTSEHAGAMATTDRSGGARADAACHHEPGGRRKTTASVANLVRAANCFSCYSRRRQPLPRSGNRHPGAFIARTSPDRETGTAVDRCGIPESIASGAS
jgi:hypothetical protein